MSKRFDAGKSLFASTALAGNVGGQKREQTVLTPRPILDACLEALGQKQFDLDPCTTHDNPVGARAHFVHRGDRIAWEDYGTSVWVNPPYEDLETWMLLAQDASGRGCLCYLLIPLRPQRSWWALLAAQADWIRTLAPFPFVGQKQAFPAPLVLLGYGAPEVDYIPSWFLKKESSRNLITGSLKVGTV